MSKTLKPLLAFNVQLRRFSGDNDAMLKHIIYARYLSVHHLGLLLSITVFYNSPIVDCDEYSKRTHQR